MAVTYYNQTVLGGTSYPRYADPLVTGKSNADGLYPWSNVRARFATILTGTEVDANYAGLTDPNLLLFSSDIPASGYIAAAATGIPVRPVSPATQVGSGGLPSFFKATPAGTDVLVPTGQVGVGYSYNSVATTDANKNIYVAGFPATAPNMTVISPELWLWTNSPNICSPVSLQNWNNATAASGALPIVLLYTSYTQAIRDAGNIFVNTTGALIGATYQVVGLFSNGK
jgi:hypothetical protein